MTTESDPSPELDAERLERIARLQARRSTTIEAGPGPGARRRRSHPAKNSRMAAGALGVSAMFGLLTAYGVAAGEPGPELAEVVPAAPAAPEPVVVVVRLVGSTGVAAAPTPPTPPTASTASVGSAVPTASVAPTVRVLSAPAPAPAAPAPVTQASTNGSR